MRKHFYFIGKAEDVFTEIRDRPEVKQVVRLPSGTIVVNDELSISDLQLGMQSLPHVAMGYQQSKESQALFHHLRKKFRCTLAAAENKYLSHLKG